MVIPLVDLKAQYNSIKEEIDAAIQRVVQQGQFILGPVVKAFEEEMASYCETRFAIGVASGTDALHLALLACGIKPPYIEKHNKCSFNYYTIRLVDSHINRAELRKHLDSNGVQTMVYYPLSLHLQQVYEPLGYKPGSFPESESAQEQVLSLPMYPELEVNDIERITEIIKDFC